MFARVAAQIALPDAAPDALCPCHDLVIDNARDGSLISPPLTDAAAWFSQFQAQEQTLLRQWLPDTWHRRFAEWITAQQQLATVGTKTH
jgi:hypothetical protein